MNERITLNTHPGRWYEFRRGRLPPDSFDAARGIARRKLNIHAADAAVIALTLADAGRDELAGERGCIFIRNGRECPGSDPASHSRHCDIPW